MKVTHSHIPPRIAITAALELSEPAVRVDCTPDLPPRPALVKSPYEQRVDQLEAVDTKACKADRLVEVLAGAYLLQQELITVANGASMAPAPIHPTG